MNVQVLPRWIRDYQSAWLAKDVLAGLTTASVVVPKAMAYATIAGLPVQVGLYTVLVPIVIYAILGTSRALSVSTTTTLAILASSAISQAAPSGNPQELLTASATLAFLVGAILIAAGALRMGFIANLVSDPVLTGFRAGVALVIIADQLPKMLGIHITKTGFFRDIISIVHAIPSTSFVTIAISGGTIVFLIAL